MPVDPSYCTRLRAIMVLKLCSNFQCTQALAYTVKPWVASLPCTLCMQTRSPPLAAGRHNPVSRQRHSLTNHTCSMFTGCGRNRSTQIHLHLWILIQSVHILVLPL